MPGFAAALDNNAVNALANFLLTGKDVADTNANNANFLKYRSTGLKLWLDPDGYPPITPPWGTLSAIDLNAGTIRWKIPFGEFPELAAKGLPSRAELALLEPLRAKLPPAVFIAPVEALGKPYRDIREQLRAAQRLLEGAGWRVKGGSIRSGSKARRRTRASTIA